MNTRKRALLALVSTFIALSVMFIGGRIVTAASVAPDFTTAIETQDAPTDTPTPTNTPIPPTPTDTPTPTNTPIPLTPTDTPTPTPTSTPLAFTGCSHGYWKQSKHFDSWTVTGYSPNQALSTVFSDTGSLGNKSLRQALRFKGGSSLTAAKQILLRDAVASLLNGAHPDVDFPLSSGQVIAAVNTALASNDRQTILSLASALGRDNNLGCPLN